MKRRHLFALPFLLPAFGRASYAASSVQYGVVQAGVPLIFPRDHGAHPNYRTEWWYVTGAVNTSTGLSGFQLTFFRVRTGAAEQLQSPLAAKQLLFAHAAISLPDNKLLHAERAARLNLGAGFSTTECDVRIGAWHLQRQTNERFSLQMQDSQFSMELSLIPTQTLMLQGKEGYSQKGPQAEMASYYVSWPQLEVQGTLTHSGKRHAVQGKAWFDHEWSSQVLGKESVGWDWIGINLSDGGALMAFRIRNAQGATVYAHAALRNAAGQMQQFDTTQISFIPLRNWFSARSKAVYPVELEIHFGPHKIQTRPVLDDQELQMHRPATVLYWEGLVNITGTLAGQGYLEMTGYAGKLNL